MGKKYDPTICPVCGESNQCQNHHLHEKRKTDNTYNTCWCFTKKFSKEAHRLILLHSGKNPACICCDCLKKAY